MISLTMWLGLDRLEGCRDTLKNCDQETINQMLDKKLIEKCDPPSDPRMRSFYHGQCYQITAAGIKLREEYRSAKLVKQSELGTHLPG